MMKLPLSIDDINATWLTEALSAQWPGVIVSDVKVGKVIHGSATKVQLFLDYQVPEAISSPPKSMWLKGGFEPEHETLAALGIYARETDFYNEISPFYRIEAPKCYFAKSQSSPSQGVALLEDLVEKGAVFNAAATPLTADVAAAGLSTLGRLHGQGMIDPDLDKRGLPVAMLESHAVLDGVVNIADQHFKTPRGYAAPVALHDAKRLSEGLKVYEAMVQDCRPTLLHGDAHVGNTYTLPGGEVGFLDWQTTGLGHWVHDVCYFMISALDIPVRRSHEKELLSHYLTAAKSSGLVTPSFEDAFLFYKRAIYYSFLVWLGNGDKYQPPETNVACFSRAGAAMIDHDVYKELGV